jgi:hypothetical protein
MCMRRRQVGPKTAILACVSDEVLGVILVNLPLGDVASISTTCQCFHRVYRILMSEEQQARCELAVRSFGGQRIACIAGLIDRLVKGEPLSLDLVDDNTSRFWVSGDGVLVPVPCQSPIPRSAFYVGMFASLSSSINDTIWVHTRAGESYMRVRIPRTCQRVTVMMALRWRPYSKPC